MTATFSTPGLDEVRAAYSVQRDHGVSPLVAMDWITELTRDVVRDDLAAQLARNAGRGAEPHHADVAAIARPDQREVNRLVQTAVSVYNGRRSRVTEVDQIATRSGAAAINRAAVLRRSLAPNEDRLAVLAALDIDEVVINGSGGRRFYVAAVLRIGDRARAASAVIVRTGKETWHRVEDFTVIHH